MKRNIINTLSVIICLALVLVSAGIAYTVGNESQENKVTSASDEDTVVSENEENTEKDETVYVLAKANGDIDRIIVSDWLKNALGNDKISDISSLSDIENVKGSESFSKDGITTVWDAEGNDIYYRGDIEKELPFELKVTYTLDGKEVSADEIAGKSGKVTIRFDYKNNQYDTVKINGKDEKIYVPFVMVTGLLLDSDVFRNIEVSNGRFLNDGDRNFIVGFALPGLSENLGIENDILSIPEYFEITADADGFTMGNTYTLASNSIFNSLDFSKFDSVDGIKEQINSLTDGITKLVNGSSDLYDGLTTLLEKSNTLASGVNELASGSQLLLGYVSDLDTGAGKINDGLSDLSSGLVTLSDNSSSLRSGAKQVFETLLSTASSQLSAAGLSVPELTIDNFENVLDSVIASLDGDAVYQQALSQVTAAVEANRSTVEAAVKSAVREQVAEAVIPAATGGQITKDSYEAAKAANMLDAATVAAIEGAIDAQMETDAVKATVSQNTDARIQKLINDNMAGEEVQAKLSAASEGVKTVANLKTSLCSYSTFYQGILTYTEGVDAAADGASQLSSGASDLKNGSSRIKDGVGTLNDGVETLKSNIPALVSGVSQLQDGAKQIKDGIGKLNDEGIKKIVGLIDGDLDGIVQRIKAISDVSKNYKNFSGISDNTEGSVKFIYRTGEIE